MKTLTFIVAMLVCGECYAGGYYQQPHTIIVDPPRVLEYQIPPKTITIEDIYRELAVQRALEMIDDALQEHKPTPWKRRVFQFK